jgi:hypothetical protein
MKTRLTRLSTAVLLGAMVLASSAANAKSNFDGSANLLCATFDISACLDGSTCVRGEARKFDMPEFMTVDFKKKVVHATYEGGEMEAESPFGNFLSTETQLIMQGVENNHGWTMAIDQNNGRMSLAVVGDEVTFSFFGACTAP